jgi:polyisoprenoid-binding protein YceI
MALETWNIDPVHSSIHFSIRHLVISKIHGRFTKWGGTIEFDEQHPASSKVNIQIDVDSIDTNDPKRDGHLKTPDFFDAEHHPQITFASTKVEPKAANEYRVAGDLTIRGITHPVTLEVEHGGQVKDMWGNNRGGFGIKGVIDRRDFGMAFAGTTESGAAILGDKIDIAIDAEAIKAAAQAAG